MLAIPQWKACPLLLKKLVCKGLLQVAAVWAFYVDDKAF